VSVAIVVLPSPLDLLTTAPCGMHAAVAVDQRHIRSKSSDR